MMTFERTYTNAAGQTVRVNVMIVEDGRMERAFRNLAQRALGSKTKCAKALGGMISVRVLGEVSGELQQSEMEGG